MPAVLRIRGFSIFIYVHDHQPPHIHIRKAEGDAKVNLHPVKIVETRGYTAGQLRQVLKIVEDNREYLLKKW